MNKFLKIITLLGTSVFLNAQNVTFNANELYPEGIGHSNKNKSFFVSSLHYGKIGKVSSDGKYSVLVDDKEIVSAIGLLADEKANRVYVAVSDPGVSVKTNAATQMKLAKLGCYDMTTGKRIFMADLGALNPNGGNFANDITKDAEGNVYVTNSFSPIIYKIDSKGTPTIFTKNDAWVAQGFSLNGIAFHNKGFLIVAQSNTGLLFKVDLKNPEKVSVIKADSIKGADGLVLNPNGKELIVISNESKSIFKLQSDDNWATAKTVSTTPSVNTFPTTGVFVKGKYYVLNAKLNEIFTPGAQLTSNYVIQEVK